MNRRVELYNTICSLKDKSAIKKELEKKQSDSVRFIDKCKKSWFSSTPNPYEGQFDNENDGAVSYAKYEIDDVVKKLNYSIYGEINENTRRWKEDPFRGFGGRKSKRRKTTRRTKTKRRRRS